MIYSMLSHMVIEQDKVEAYFPARCYTDYGITYQYY